MGIRAILLRARTRACAWAAVWAALALLVLPAAANVRLDLADLPPENRVGGFSETVEHCAGPNIAFVQYPRLENEPILAMTASGRLFWPSRDPLGEAADPLHNLYRFVGNNPLNAVDPDGRAPQLLTAVSGGPGFYGPDRDWGDYDSQWGGRRSRFNSVLDPLSATERMAGTFIGGAAIAGAAVQAWPYAVAAGGAMQNAYYRFWTSNPGMALSGMGQSGQAMSGAASKCAKSGGSAWQNLPGGVQIKQTGNYWVKEVDASASTLAQWWGRGSLNAQARGLAKLGDMAPSYLFRNGKLITRDVGSYTPGNFWRTWAEGSRRLGTLFNDIRPRNIGTGGLIFDPAKHPIQQSLEAGAVGLGIGTGGMYLYNELSDQP